MGHPYKLSAHRSGVSTRTGLLAGSPELAGRCGEAKARCLFSLQPDRCDRRIATNGDSAFTPSKRGRARAHPYLHRQRRTPVPEPSDDHVSDRLMSQLPSPPPSSPRDSASARPLPKPSPTTTCILAITNGRQSQRRLRKGLFLR